MLREEGVLARERERAHEGVSERESAREGRGRVSCEGEGERFSI